MANLMLSLKTALISTGIISVAILFKVSLPLVSELITSGIPSTYSLVLSFLRPPYLYLLINCIIISIVASSKLQHKAETQQSPSPEIVLPAVKVSSEVYSSEYSYGSDTSARVAAAEDLRTVEETKGEMVVDGGDEDEQVKVVMVDVGDEEEQVKVVMVDGGVEEEQVKVVMVDGGDEKEQGKVVMSPSPPPPARSESMELVMSLLNEKAAEKPSVSKRFGQRKAVKAASEGKALRVSKPKRLDTLESTWKTITEGRPMPLTRHLKKSDTWEERAQKDPNAPPPPLPHTVKKSDTFNEHPKGASLTRSSGSGKLKKDPSLSQDELNRRVEAFIKKFNQEMRLQRQESWNQYQEMIRRGAE